MRTSSRRLSDGCGTLVLRSHPHGKARACTLQKLGCSKTRAANVETTIHISMGTMCYLKNVSKHWSGRELQQCRRSLTGKTAEFNRIIPKKLVVTSSCISICYNCPGSNLLLYLVQMYANLTTSIHPTRRVHFPVSCCTHVVRSAARAAAKALDPKVNKVNDLPISFDGVIQIRNTYLQWFI